MAIAVVAVAGVNIWKTAGDVTVKFDLSHWNLEKLAYADPTLTDGGGWEVYQNGDYLMLYKSSSGHVIYCYGTDQEPCGVQGTDYDGNPYEFVSKCPRRDY